MPSQPSLATGRRRAAVVLLLVALVSGLLVTAPTTPAGAADSIPRSQLLQWSNGTSFISTGANAALTIDLGRNAFVGDCPSGFNDVAYAQTDIYIVPAGSVSDGATLQDVSGTPNTTLPSGTVWGGELIGYTAPTGDVGEGEWAVVYDECQNGKFEADTDALFDPAIRVSITADVPPLPGIEALKAAAHEEALIWADFAKDYTIFLNAAEVLGLISGGTGILYDAIVYLAMGQIGSYLPDVKTAAIVLLLNNAKHYAGIAADPPDPDFEQPTTLVPRPELEAGGDGPMLEELLAVAEATASEAALAEALLHSMERYQGADLASDGDWALVHARQLQDNARLLGDQMAHTSAAVDDLLAALDDHGAGAFEAHVAQLETLRSRLVTDGYSDAEVRAAAAAGITEAQLDDFRASLEEEDFSGFTDEWLRALLADLQASHAAMPAVLDDVALSMQPIVDWLVDDPGTEDLLPVVRAGGPYTGEEGIAIPFDASASTSASPITAYEWDLDADGEFDDATGATPSFTFTEPFDGLVGVRVTNEAGANVGYAHLTVLEQDGAPRITAAAPAASSIRLTTGSSQAFSVTATDDEQETLTTTWLVDGVEAGTGATFDLAVADDDLGLHTVAAVVSDGSPIGGSTTRLWSVIVQRPDVDEDGWAVDLDCDDTDADVNPGAHEVIGNGIDDDCDPDTSDDGSLPTVSIDPPGTVVAGEAAGFAATADDADGAIVGYQWDFGDGATSDEASPSHTFATPGTRTVSLTVTDEQGDTATASATVTVLARPEASFTAIPIRPEPGEDVELTDTSTDADGTIAAWAWDFGDGTTSTDQHPTHAFAAPGTHEVRLTVTDDDGLAATTTVAVRVAAPGVAAFTTAKLREALDGVPGAGALASSVYSATTTDRAANAIDGSDTTYWRSAVAPAGEQDLRFSLPAAAVVSQLRLSTPNNGNALREFQLQLSTTGTADADFATVLTAEAARGPGQLFSFPPTSARFARLVVLSNHGGTTTQVGTVSLTTRDREGGIVSLGSGGPTASISQVSSEYSASQGAKALIDGSPTGRWRTVAGSFPQSATIDLATQSDSVVEGVVLTGLAHASSVRAFEIQVAASADPAAFTTVLSGELPMTATPTTFAFPATEASRVRILVLSTWGEPFAQLGELAVLDHDGVNVALATASSNGTVVHASSQVTSTPGKNAIDFATGTYWGTPSGTTSGAITVRLRDAQPYLIDHVEVRGNTSTSSVRDVEIQVSATTADDDAFVTVASGVVPRDGRARSFTFPTVEARFVRLVASTNHGGTTLQVNDLRVWSPTRGGEDVAFDDLSSVDGTIATWAWSFGDGTTSAEQHPVHTYAAPGTYPVTLTITDADGRSTTTTMPYTVVPRPQADFTWAPAVPGEQTSVAFQDTSTPALSWRYTSEAFNNALTGQNPNGVFPDDGAWPVTLEIVDAELRTTSTTNVVTVSNRPPTANAGTDRTVMWRQPLTVDAHVGDPSPVDASSLACDWDFGDGQTMHVEPCNGTTVDVTHAYPHPGTYTATLTVSDDDGGVTTDSRQVVATTRPSFVQVVGTEAVGDDVVVTVRALDGPDVFGIVGVPVQVAHGTASVTATTDDRGFATATLPRQVGVATVEASFAGNSSYDPAPTVSKDLLAAPGDIVFIIDESGSMSSVQAAVRRNLFEMSRLLGEQIDFRIGIVGFGGRQAVEIHLPLTDDLEAVHDTLEALVTTGSFEPGYHATVAAMSDAMGYRPGAGACGVLIGDELPQRNTGQATLEEAIAAARARNATMFGIVSTHYPEVAAGYGPEPGSLTYETGGDAWPIAGFPDDPTPVLDALLDQCVTRIIAPGVGVAIDGTPDEVGAGATVEYTVTVDNDSPGAAAGVDLGVQLPAGLAVDAASDGGTVTPASGDDPAVLSWPAFTLDGNASTTRTFTAHVVAGTPAGPLPLVATVADDGTRGPDRDPSDNTATVETVVLATKSAPVVDAGPDLVIEEGSSAEVFASFVDPDGPASAATHAATIDWGEGPAPLSVGSDGGLAPATRSFADDATLSVEVCVSDDDGLEGCDTTTVTVTNAAPVPAGLADATVDVGSELVLGPVAFVDAGPADTHIASVGFGDGSPVQAAVVDAATRTVTVPAHTYASAGDHTVAVCIADDDGAIACTTATVTVSSPNQAPVADAGGPYLTVEGTPVMLDATGSHDPDGDALTYGWDLDGDGDHDDATGPHPVLPALDDAVVAIELQVTDPSGLVATSGAVVTVTNAPPVISTVEALDDQTLSADELAFVVHFTDAGPADTHRAVVDVEGRQIVVEGYASGTPIVVPVSQAGCTVGVEVEVHDDDGGVDTASTTGRTIRGTWLAPLRIDGSARRVEAGQVLPVKVRLEACSGSTELQPSIRVRRGDGVTRGGEMTGEELTLPTVSSSQTHGVMRRTGNHFQYDLLVDLAPGTWTILVYPNGTSGPSIRHLIDVR